MRGSSFRLPRQDMTIESGKTENIKIKLKPYILYPLLHRFVPELHKSFCPLKTAVQTSVESTDIVTQAHEYSWMWRASLPEELSSSIFRESPVDRHSLINYRRVVCEISKTWRTWRETGVVFSSSFLNMLYQEKRSIEIGFRQIKAGLFF